MTVQELQKDITVLIDQYNAENAIRVDHIVIDVRSDIDEGKNILADQNAFFDFRFRGKEPLIPKDAD